MVGWDGIRKDQGCPVKRGFFFKASPLSAGGMDGPRAGGEEGRWSSRQGNRRGGACNDVTTTGEQETDFWMNQDLLTEA